MNETEHPTAVELAEAVALGNVGTYARHLEQCVECRVRLTRLMHGSGAPDSPSGDVLRRIVAGSGRLSSAAAASAGSGADAEPQRGEVWRAGGEQALLVWVRKVLDGAIDAVPVTLDIEFADEYALLLSSDQTHLSLPLAIFTALRSHVHPDAMLSRVTTLDNVVAAHVEEAIRAAVDGRKPDVPAIGSPVHDAEDQIVEYQQLLVDMLADLAPSRWNSTFAESKSASQNGGEILSLLNLRLMERHPCRIYGNDSTVAMLPSGAAIRSVARVAFADTSLVVAELSDWQSYKAEHLAVACRRILDQELGAHAVAVCGSGPGWETIVVRAADTREAYEPPIGARVPPRLPREPLPLIDALAKYLDAAVPAWQDADASAVVPSVDLATVAATAARAAVDDLISQGGRARTPAKNQAWTGLGPQITESVRDAVTRIASGEHIGDVLDELSGGRS